MLHEFIISTPYYISVLTHDLILETSYSRSQLQSKGLKSAPTFVVLPKSLNVPAPPAGGKGEGGSVLILLKILIQLSSRVRT